MELGHCGQAAAIIKPRGVAEMHRRDHVRPCQQPQRVAFKRPCECVWNTVTWQSASARAPHRLSLFITLNISHETNELDLSWRSLFWIWWITWNGAERRSVDEEREQGNTEERYKPAPASSVINPPELWLQLRQSNSRAEVAEIILKPVITPVWRVTEAYCLDAAEPFGTCFFTSPTTNPSVLQLETPVQHQYCPPWKQL